MKFCKPKPKSILSLDIGSKRIGLAYCDPLCITSNILPAVKRFENNQEIKIIRNYINKFNLTGFIVGIPLDERGQMTSQAIDCKITVNYFQMNLSFHFLTSTNIVQPGNLQKDLE